MGNQNHAPSSIKSGYLIQNLGDSKRRCFVRLTNTTLCVEHTPTNTEKINLQQIAEIMLCQQNEQQFELLPINIKFICKTSDEARDWISRFQALICTHESNHSNDNNENKCRGSLIFQKNYYTAKQMECINDSYDAGKSAIFVFGDNDIDKNRENKTTIKRRHNGGQAGVIGKYDDRFGYGITTTFINKETPELLEFSDIIKQQFAELKSFLENGRDIIIPSPTAMDMEANKDMYFKNNKQTIYHNLGTGIANLPSGHIQYIQIQINELQTFADNNIDICSVEYYGYNAFVNINEDKYEFERKMHEKEMENMALKMKILTMENKKLKSKLENNKKENQTIMSENINENEDELKTLDDFSESVSSSGSESYETLKPECERTGDDKLHIDTRNNLSGWQWSDNNGKLICCDNIFSELIEKCKVGSKFRFKFAGDRYVFYRLAQNEGVQINVQTGRKREAKRIYDDDDDDGIWQWNKRDRNIWEGVPDGIWIAYSDEISAKINKLNADLLESFKCNINGHTYLITKLSVNKAVQTNLETNTVRDVRKKPTDDINNNMNDVAHQNQDDEKLKELEDLKKRIGYKMEWQWKENGKWHSSCSLTQLAEILKIGATYAGVIWSHDNKVYTIDRASFDSGTLTLLGSAQTWPLRRKESVSKKFRYKYPAWWNLNLNSQPGSCRKYEKPILIDLYPNKDDTAHAATKDIIQIFNKCMPQYEIVGIQGIQNRRLFEKYEIEKESLSKTTKVNEKILYHETTRHAIESIKNEGFRNEFCKKDRDFYGKGIYFGVRPDISHAYVNVADQNGIHSTLVCKVITGECAIGHRSYALTNWPRKQNKLIVDSLVSKDGKIYVIHGNGRAYPMFIMHFIPKHNKYNNNININRYYNNNNIVNRDSASPHFRNNYGNNGYNPPSPHCNHSDDNTFAPQRSPPSDDNDSNDSIQSSNYRDNILFGKPTDW